MSLDVTALGVAPGRFREASRYYTTGRPSYPAALIDRVAEIVGLDRSRAVLDIGTGPGLLAIDFARFAGRVVALDPSDDMLDQARINAREAGADVTFIKGVAADIEPGLGRFHLAAIGRAFHWLDRRDTLERLDRVVEAGGAVALFSDHSPKVRENAWLPAYTALREKYSAADPAREALRGVLSSHDDFLLESAFDQVERVAVLERRETPLDRFADRILSFGASWAGESGVDPQRVAADAREVLAPFAVDGLVHEIVEGEAVVARRSR